MLSLGITGARLGWLKPGPLCIQKLDAMQVPESGTRSRFLSTSKHPKPHRQHLSKESTRNSMSQLP
jgi:hypothetical protein